MSFVVGGGGEGVGVGEEKGGCVFGESKKGRKRRTE